MFKTVIFDLDGTLLDTLGDLTDASNHICAQNGWPTFTQEQVRHMVGNGNPKLVERFTPERERTPERLAESLRQFMAGHSDGLFPPRHRRTEKGQQNGGAERRSVQYGADGSVG